MTDLDALDDIEGLLDGDHQQDGRARNKLRFSLYQRNLRCLVAGNQSRRRAVPITLPSLKCLEQKP
jgi:hypothetical protein